MGEQRYVLRVTGTGERRGSAEVARTLYEETPESLAERTRLAEQRKLTASSYDFDVGRPSKKDRRDLNRFRER